ncbi:hypothetical protein L596_006986 [Steinernema carpocapsae]|uniref:Uncharacterized protein n=1 Tax=Steinernema carpocapsae TaxID=34508 RepID=A0A4V6A5U4_STECR|nr:hypothetical protein L596_006986 [Steinernema carpocapsae]
MNQAISSIIHHEITNQGSLKSERILESEFQCLPGNSSRQAGDEPSHQEYELREFSSREFSYNLNFLRVEEKMSYMPHPQDENKLVWRIQLGQDARFEDGDSEEGELLESLPPNPGRRINYPVIVPN